MSKTKHRWLPGGIEQRLEMAANWVTVLQARRLAWGVPEEEIEYLEQDLQNARALQTQATGAGATREIRARRDQAVNTLVKRMERIKSHWFFKPPLFDADFISLTLSPPDGTHTPIGVPDTPPVFRIIIKGIRQVIIEFHFEGSSSRGIPYGYHCAVINWGFFETAPASPDELLHSVDATRSPFTVPFKEEDRGKRVWFVLRWQNERGEQGPASEMVSAIVP